MSLLIIAHVFLLRAVDSFKRSSRGRQQRNCSPAGIHGWDAAPNSNRLCWDCQRWFPDRATVPPPLIAPTGST